MLDMDPTNESRATLAEKAVRKFAKDSGIREGDQSFDTTFVDLLSDLMHLADREGLVWSELVRRATEHHDVETETDDEQLDEPPMLRLTDAQKTEIERLVFAGDMDAAVAYEQSVYEQSVTGRDVCCICKQPFSEERPRRAGSLLSRGIECGVCFETPDEEE